MSVPRTIAGKGAGRTRRARGRRRAPSQGTRDQAPSTFTQILDRLVRAIPGATAAVLVDYDGETVDYTGTAEAFDLKVAAAHWQIVLSQIEPREQRGQVKQLIVRARKRSYVIRQIHPSYTVVLVLHPHAAFAGPGRALEGAAIQLCSEAGLPSPPANSRWHPVDVETCRHDRARPAKLRVADEWQPVEVMGCMVGLGPRERGFRIRLPTGAELLLVREPYGIWFADEKLADED